MRVFVLGKGELAIKICEWFNKSGDHELFSVVPVKPEPNWTESLSLWAKQNNIPLVESGHYKDLDIEEIDLAMSIFYDKIIKSNFIDKCKKIITENINQLHIIAKGLLEYETLTGEEIINLTNGIEPSREDFENQDPGDDSEPAGSVPNTSSRLKPGTQANI